MSALWRVVRRALAGATLLAIGWAEAQREGAVEALAYLATLAARDAPATK